MAYASLVTIDVGNSRTKLAWFEGQPDRKSNVDSVEISRWSHGDTPHWPGTQPTQVFVGSVAPKLSKELIDSFPSNWPDPHVIQSKDFHLAAVKLELDAVGVDRVANAKAASILFPDEHILIIDAGTATTVDWVDSDGAFRGGAILPGLQLSANALTDRTELLPNINMTGSSPAAYPATNTTDAIKVGATAAAIGGVSHVIELARKSTGDTPRILCCGGDGQFLSSHLSDALFVDALTLLGLTWFEQP